MKIAVLLFWFLVLVTAGTQEPVRTHRPTAQKPIEQSTSLSVGWTPCPNYVLACLDVITDDGRHQAISNCKMRQDGDKIQVDIAELVDARRSLVVSWERCLRHSSNGAANFIFKRPLLDVKTKQ